MQKAEKQAFRRRMRKIREEEWIRDAILLRKRTPEESLKMMFEMCEFAQKLNRSEKWQD